MHTLTLTVTRQSAQSGIRREVRCEGLLPRMMGVIAAQPLHSLRPT
ncbi:hypothetical protein OKW46_006367 [Paraburkholderia sp. WSM4179]|nr:hypothetical protein [Paraburkholderia sp. WSM4179]